MLDKYLMVAYGAEQKKTAERQLVGKLKEFPTEELESFLRGDDSSKLASYVGDCAKEAGGSDFCWLDKYKGTPLFQQAVELEKALLQLDMEDQQLREQERAVRPQPSDTWAKRDALQLQKRMLDLDLVMAQNGGGTPEAKEEHAINELQQAQAQEQVEGGGPDAQHEDLEDAAIDMLEQAHGSGGAGAPKPPAPPQAQPPQPPQPPKAKAPSQGEGGEEEGEAGAPPKKDEKSKGMSVEVKQAAAQVARAVDAGRFFAKLACDGLKAEVAKKYPKLVKEKTAASIGTIPAVLGAAAGANKGHAQGEPGSGAIRGAAGAGLGAHYGGELGLMLGREHPGAGLLGAAAGGLAGYGLATRKYDKAAPQGARASAFRDPPPAEAAASTVEDYSTQDMSPDERRQLIQELRGNADHVDNNTGKIRATRALLGGGLGAAAGGLLAGGKGALVGGGAGALLSALPKPSGQWARDDAAALEQHHFPQEKQAGLLGGALNAVKGAVPALGGMASGAKNLATTAHAAGGMPGVASAFGNVAKQFAQKNPLTAAGITGVGGMVAGKMMSNSQPRT